MVCSPEVSGAFSREQEDALWQRVFTAQPARRRKFEPSSKHRKRRPAPWRGEARRLIASLRGLTRAAEDSTAADEARNAKSPLTSN
jgi:hypothetical protein